jgi:hypothetical protein
MPNGGSFVFPDRSVKRPKIEGRSFGKGKTVRDPSACKTLFHLPGAFHNKHVAAVRFSVFQQGEKKCHYCVWITDEALSRFDSSGDFDAVIAARSDAWRKWVEKKIDAEDFRNRALRIDAAGEQEIDLSDMKAHVAFD